MSLNKKQLSVFCCAAVLGAAGFFAFAPELEAQRQDRMLAGCEEVKAGDNQLECIFRALSKEMKGHGLGSTMELFDKAYERFPGFVSGGCHHQAHRVGDLAYYNLYLGVEDLEKIDFTQSTTACGYGFYHGFLEHLIQDRPQAQFIDDVCTYLTERLGKTMGDIRLTCYHGAGHGLILAQIERLGVEDWGDLRKFTDEPVGWCRQLKSANNIDLQQCLEGIFNVVVDSMADNKYGFSYDYDRPFDVCDALPQNVHWACYYEMAQKLDRASQLDPVKLAELSMAAGDPQHRLTAFKVGIAGIVQQVIVNGNASEVLERCAPLKDELYSACLESLVNGLYEHGDPQREYEKALQLCAHPLVESRGMGELCYGSVAKRLQRFYDEGKIAGICSEFPAQYRRLCEAKMGERY